MKHYKLGSQFSFKIIFDFSKQNLEKSEFNLSKSLENNRLTSREIKRNIDTTEKIRSVKKTSV